MLFGGRGADHLDGGAGYDYARYDEADYGNLFVSLSDPAINTGAATGDTYTGIEGLVLGEGHDYAWGDGGDNEITTLGGNDMLFGGWKAGTGTTAGRASTTRATTMRTTATCWSRCSTRPSTEVRRPAIASSA